MVQHLHLLTMALCFPLQLLNCRVALEHLVLRQVYLQAVHRECTRQGLHDGIKVKDWCSGQRLQVGGNSTKVTLVLGSGHNRHILGAGALFWVLRRQWNQGQLPR